MCSPILLSLLLVLSAWTGVSPDTQVQRDPCIRAVFCDTFEAEEVELERMVMDRSTNRLYVGGVNHLYDIALHDLSVQEHVITGPRLDSPLCADVLKGCNEALLPTNSYTKALAIDQNANQLIECTSLYQGRCRTRNLSNISREADIRPSYPGTVANDRSSTAIFVGTGPPLRSGRSSINIPAASSTRRRTLIYSKVLYVASTYVPVNSYFTPSFTRDSLDVPSVSSLSLEPSRLFEYTSTRVSSGTRMKQFGAYALTFRIEYAGGFEAGGFAYFTTRQPKYVGDNQPTISKLIRVCTQDPDFYSYTEIPLECVRNGVHYNLVQDVYVGNPGFDFAQSLGIKVSDQVLFAVFAQSEVPVRNVTSWRSAFCAYPLRLIEEKFFENIRECFKGRTRTNLPCFKSDKKCTATRYPDSEIMCGKDINSYIGGEVPVVGDALLIDETSLFTSITATSVQKDTVAFVGTASGVLHEAFIEGQGESSIVKSIQLTDGLPILPDMELDDKNGLLYEMSKRTLYKVNVRTCSGSLDCHSCLETGDLLRLEDDACDSRAEVCTANALFSKAVWSNYKSGRCRTTIRIVSAIFGSLLLLAPIVVVCFFYRRLASKNMKRRDEQQKNAYMSVSPDAIPFDDLSSFENSTSSPMLNSAHIKVLQLVGGAIYQNGSHEEAVAVKKIMNGHFEREDVMYEIGLMSACSHKNILQFIGHYRERGDQNVHIVTEFMEGGDLHKYLRSDENIPTIGLAFSYVLQLVDGMVYLTKQHIIHRDLAARNCLLDKYYQCLKIIDFGLCRRSDIDYQYVSFRNGLMPFRWLALECFDENEGSHYSEKSDVWAFGVTVWEIFTRGNPYENMGVFDVQKHLREGQRLPLDTYTCPDELKDVMLQCWAEYADQRPSFKQLKDRVTNIYDGLKHNSEYMQQQYEVPKSIEDTTSSLHSASCDNKQP